MLALLKTGSRKGARGPQPRPLAERFASKIRKTPKCWFWEGGTAGRGDVPESAIERRQMVEAWAHPRQRVEVAA